MHLSPKYSLLIVILLTLASATAALAVTPTFEELQKIPGPSGAGTGYASDVALDGETAIVGEPYAAGGGKVWVYRREGTGWTEAQVLSASDGEADNYFGQAIAIEGDVILTGAPHTSPHVTGAAYVFRYDGTSWQEEQRLFPSAAGDDLVFGYDVALSGDAAFVTALGDNNQVGAVYVFRFDGVSWVEEQRLVPTGGELNDFFGYSVAAHSDVVCVGASGDDDLGADAGAAYIFRHDGTQWVEEQKLTVSDAGDFNNLGKTMSLGDGVVLMGTQDQGFGAVYSFRFDGSTWIEEQKLTSSNAAIVDGFGLSIAMDGDLAFISSLSEDSSRGATYVFDYDGTSWTERDRLVASDPFVGNKFGLRIALDSGAAVISASNLGVGATYMFSTLVCMEGTVNSGAGDVTTLLYVNGSSGGDDRTVDVLHTDLISVTMLKPIAGGNGKFVLHVNDGSPLVTGQELLPFDIGTTCFPFLLSNGATPSIVANNVGKTGLVGESMYYGTPADDPDRATVTLHYPQLPPGTTMTLQALIIDPNSVSPKSASTTNAVILCVVP